jgi:ATP-dependent Clp protease ATP-binding subunit ClpC
MDETSARSLALHEQMKGKILSELKNTFRPEFLNRIDETIVFHPLNRDDTRQIAFMMIREVEERLREQGITLVCDESVAEQLAAEGYDEAFGARPLRLVVQHRLEDTLSEELLSGRIHIGDQVTARAENGELIYTTEKEPLLLEAEMSRLTDQ